MKAFELILESHPDEVHYAKTNQDSLAIIMLYNILDIKIAAIKDIEVDSIEEKDYNVIVRV